MALVTLIVSVPDREPERGVEPLVPPAIQNGAVEASVWNHFHPARAAFLRRSSWIVKPHVHSLNQGTCHLHVVVFNEYHPLPAAFVIDELNKLLDEALASVVARMALTGDHDLDRAFRMVQQV